MLACALGLCGCSGSANPGAVATSDSAAPAAAPTAPPPGTAPAAAAGASTTTAAVNVVLGPPADVPGLDALAFVDARQGWAAGGGTILATADGGSTWTVQYTGGPSLRITALDFVDAEHGWAVAGPVLLRTIDGGATWAPVGGVGAAASGASAPSFGPVDFVSATVGWAVGGSTLLVTSDAGATWRAAALPDGAAAAAVCFGTPTDGWALGGTGVYRTVDGGATWTTAHRLTVAAPIGADWRVGCAGAQAVWALATLGAGMMQQAYVVLRTTDGGARWSTPLAHGIGGPGPGAPANVPGIDAYVGPFAVAPGGRAALFVGQCPACGMAPASIAMTADGGGHWVRQTFSGLSTDPTAAALPDPAHGWITAISGGTGRILATADGGATWTQQYPAAVTPTLAVDLLAPGMAYGLGTAADPAAVLRSTDGGVTWTRVGSLPTTADGPPGYLPGQPLLSFWDAESGYAITADGGLASTGDAGRHWSPVPLAPSGWTTVASAGDGRYGCALADLPGTNARAMGTDDGGRTWTAPTPSGGGALACVLGLQAQPAWTALLGGLATAAGPATLLAAPAPADAWAIRGGRLEHTVDAADTWSTVALRDATGLDYAVQGLTFADPTHGLLLTDGGLLLVTADGGVHSRETAS